MFILLWRCPSSLIPRPHLAFSCLLTILQVTEHSWRRGGGGKAGSEANVYPGSTVIICHDALWIGDHCQENPE